MHYVHYLHLTFCQGSHISFFSSGWYSCGMRNVQWSLVGICQCACRWLFSLAREHELWRCCCTSSQLPYGLFYAFPLCQSWTPKKCPYPHGSWWSGKMIIKNLSKWLFWVTDWRQKSNILPARTVVSPGFSNKSSLLVKRYLTI